MEFCLWLDWLLYYSHYLYQLVVALPSALEGSFVLDQDVYTSDSRIETPSLWIPAFMPIDKLHWLPIHSLMLMFDQLHCKLFFSVLPAVDQVWTTFHLLYLDSWANLCQGKLYLLLVIFMWICKYFSRTKSQIRGHAFLRLSIQLQIYIHKTSIFKYNYKHVIWTQSCRHRLPNPFCLLFWVESSDSHEGIDE